MSGFVLLALVQLACGWQPAPVPIQTRWASAVRPDQLPAYPRPGFDRESSATGRDCDSSSCRWISLNGVWRLDYENYANLTVPPFGQSLPAEILVPYPIESALSGLRKQPRFGYLWYSRRLPGFASRRAGERLLLHFGSVDWKAEVYVAGRLAGRHRGGYSPWSLDISELYQPGAELLVGVYDPSDCVRQTHQPDDGPSGCPANLLLADAEGQQPIGKQMWGVFGNGTGTQRSQGIKYTPTSGIWQTVWLERVPQCYMLASSRIETEIEGQSGFVTVTPAFGGSCPDPVRFGVEVYNRTTGEAITARKSTDSSSLTVLLPAPLRPWSPSTPHLYGLRLSAGVRSIKVLRSAADGLPRTHLNGKPYYQAGVLGQGFYPESIYAAPTDDALEQDILALRELGFNMVRKHLLREPERWYHYADLHGILVWQDMPSSFNLTGDVAQAQFEAELAELVISVRNHPSVVQFNVFNEGWGQQNMVSFDGWQQFTGKMVGLVTNLVGRSMLVADATGGACGCGTQCASKDNPDGEIHGAGCWGDIQDQHGGRPGCELKPNTSTVDTSKCTPRPHLSVAGEPDRSAQNGEYGGQGFTKAFWSRMKSWGCRPRGSFDAASGEEYAEIYYNLSMQFAELKKAPTAFSAGVFDCWTDVETECDGFLSYDRLVKVPPLRMRQANALLTADNV